MSALTDFAEKLALDWMFTTGAAVRPTTWFLALFVAAPSDAGGGTEVSGNGYARQAIAFTAGVSPAGTTSNSNAPTFTAAGGNWGNITHIAIMTALNGGNSLMQGPMTAVRTINDGDTLTFVPGDITLTLA